QRTQLLQSRNRLSPNVLVVAGNIRLINRAGGLTASAFYPHQAGKVAHPPSCTGHVAAFVVPAGSFRKVFRLFRAARCVTCLPVDVGKVLIQPPRVAVFADALLDKGYRRRQVAFWKEDGGETISREVLRIKRDDDVKQRSEQGHADVFGRT